MNYKYNDVGRRRRQPKAKLLRFKFWFFTLLLFIVFTVGVVYFGKQKQNDINPVKFDFYTTTP